ncbi:hypothetical protein JW824_12400 [bacterium]|nr:hypothetical protein [bacterium]RQV92081.1 MAG: hypothetical protein EH221_12415 [bacterium]
MIQHFADHKISSALNRIDQSFHIHRSILLVIVWIMVFGEVCGQNGPPNADHLWLNKYSNPIFAADLILAAVLPDRQSVSTSQFTPQPGSRIRIDEARFADIDRHALRAPQSVRHSVERLAAYLTEPCRNDLEKVRSIYRWITENISYDVEGYRSGNYGDLSPESVLSSGSAVCSGYTGLFGMLADASGIEVIEISGWAKGIGYEAGDPILGPTNHAWNAVKIGDGWYLIDSTWGAGSSDGIRFVRQFEEHYFLTPPEQFIFDHLPEDPSWQLLEYPLSESQFVHLPHVKSHFFRNGLEIVSHFQSVVETDHQISIALQTSLDLSLSARLIRNGQSLDQSLTFTQRTENSQYQINALFPAPSDYILRIFVRPIEENGPYWQAIDYKIKVGRGMPGPIGFPEIMGAFAKYGVTLHAPRSGYLKIGEVEPFILYVPKARKVAVIMGDSWFHLKENNGFFEGNVKVQEGEIRVCAEFLREGQYECLLQYTAF